MSKIKIEIKNRFTGSILFEYEKENNTIRETVEAAVKAEADLSWADLSWANLSKANLSQADLSWANLSQANLSWANLSQADLSWANLSQANLSWANLSEADLSWANLSKADLSEADLSKANLSKADLSEADLSWANLSKADLSKADLSEANLSEADLSWANLSEANLSKADLSKANLSEANLSEADLSIIKNDLWAVLLHSIPEIPFLKQNLIDGKIDGTTYDGECACLSGTLEHGAIKNNGEKQDFRVKSILSCRDSNRPIERFFLAIRKGDTPETNQVSKICLEWLNEFESLISIK